MTERCFVWQHGTACPSLFEKHRLRQPSNDNWRHF